MAAQPLHLSDREWRLVLYIEEVARYHDLSRADALSRYGQAAQLTTVADEASARALRKLARRIVKGDIPGWIFHAQ